MHGRGAWGGGGGGCGELELLDHVWMIRGGLIWPQRSFVFTSAELGDSHHKPKLSEAKKLLLNRFSWKFGFTFKASCWKKSMIWVMKDATSDAISSLAVIDLSEIEHYMSHLVAHQRRGVLWSPNVLSAFSGPAHYLICSRWFNKTSYPHASQLDESRPASRSREGILPGLGLSAPLLQIPVW